MALSFRSGTAADGYLRIDGADIMKITSTGLELITGKTLILGGDTASYGQVVAQLGFISIAGTSNMCHILPRSTNTYDLGSATYRWRNIYTNDLQLSNGIGDYTIVEGEDDLFLYNNKKGKVYKFALIEVDPADAPAKASEE